MKTAVLFAGQGSQTVGMGKDLYDNYEEFRRVFDLLTPEEPVSYTHLTLPTKHRACRSRWSPYH